MDDRAIIQLFQSRDEAAISAVREKYGAYCGSVALGITGDEQDAEECVSDALYRLWDSIPPAEPKSLRAFAGRITRNISINRLRDASRQKRGGAEISRRYEALRKRHGEKPHAIAETFTAAVRRGGHIPAERAQRGEIRQMKAHQMRAAGGGI